MCTVSMIGDDWANKRHGPIFPASPYPGVAPQPVSREEFEALRREMLALRALLEAAKKYHEATGQPDCHMEEKVALIRRVAEMVGVDMKDVFGA